MLSGNGRSLLGGYTFLPGNRLAGSYWSVLVGDAGQQTSDRHQDQHGCKRQGAKAVIGLSHRLPPGGLWEPTGAVS